MKQKHVTAIPQTNDPKTRDRFYRKNTEFFRLVEQIKLWPTRSGVLHGVKSIEIYGETARITTFCGASFLVRNSKNSRAARWLRNKWCRSACKACKIPAWKIAKYQKTHMNQNFGLEL
ncbi:MAG: pyrrolysine--tRNA(Pyl) ligase small subunit [Veillonellaceae bacterium]|uniref:pyrrolysine--tRNA(Pyl) ligase small subunit n=1 Tax=uncultured Selenomonas sp. TaxID=159275 RepID=UPI0025F8E2DE|nr:pyrrolysine--tRNA(Pyl) ligase small subunit [uncultured Selenomonas sp.]MCI7540982.1 pyrrolysine--tRNA(Pyl) ligase small subunit [Veillonellaceae bacterium]